LENNTVGLDPTELGNLNKSARLAVFGLGYGFNPVIFRDGAICGSVCAFENYNSGTGILVFNVTEFSNYTSSNNSKLALVDDTDSVAKFVNNLIYFRANYTNVTSNLSINGSGVYCEIKFNITGVWTSSVNATFNATLKVYDYNRSFNISGTFDWNVVCNGSAQNYEILNVTDQVVVSASAKHWNNTFDTTGKNTGLWNLTGQAVADFFYDITASENRNFTLTGISLTGLAKVVKFKGPLVLQLPLASQLLTL